jgi:receptor protein-tyrosine kinase
METTTMDMTADTATPPTARGRDRKARMIGALLVEAGLLNEAQVEQVQHFANGSGMRFGDAAVQLKLVTDDDIDLALRRQFDYPILPRGANGVADDVVAAYDPDCAVAENLRTIRSRLSLNWLNESKRNVLAVVSPDASDGRSWFAANLATVFAQAGERTLLIDADMRRPRQHQLFGTESNPGLSALLTGRAGREIIRRVHPRFRLSVLAAGTPPPNPQELITRNIFDVVIERLTQQFDLIILDTPPASESADAELLAARAGAAVLLARLNHSKEKVLTDTAQSLTRYGVQIVGSVVNAH